MSTLDPKLVAMTDQGEASASAAVDRTMAVWRKYQDQGWSSTQVLLGVTIGLQEGVVAARDDGAETIVGMLAVCIGRLVELQRAKEERSGSAD